MLEELKLKRFEAKQRKRQRQAVDRATARAVLANCERTTPWIIQPAFPVGRVFWGMLWRCGLICGCVGGLLLAGHLL